MRPEEWKPCTKMTVWGGWGESSSEIRSTGCYEVSPGKGSLRAARSCFLSSLVSLFFSLHENLLLGVWSSALPLPLSILQEKRKEARRELEGGGGCLFPFMTASLYIQFWGSRISEDDSWSDPSMRKNPKHFGFLTINARDLNLSALNELDSHNVFSFNSFLLFPTRVLKRKIFLHLMASWGYQRVDHLYWHIPTKCPSSRHDLEWMIFNVNMLRSRMKHMIVCNCYSTRVITLDANFSCYNTIILKLLSPQENLCTTTSKRYILGFCSTRGYWVLLLAKPWDKPSP